jgi:hypothetical protein
MHSVLCQLSLLLISTTARPIVPLPDIPYPQAPMDNLHGNFNIFAHPNGPNVMHFPNVDAMMHYPAGGPIHIVQLGAHAAAPGVHAPLHQIGVGIAAAAA